MVGKDPTNKTSKLNPSWEGWVGRKDPGQEVPPETQRRRGSRQETPRRHDKTK